MMKQKSKTNVGSFSEQSVKEAVELVLSEGVCLREAARRTGVTFSTLFSRPNSDPESPDNPTTPKKSGSTQYGFLNPAQFKGYPKSKQRSLRRKGREKGKSIMTTNNPEKNGLEMKRKNKTLLLKFKKTLFALYNIRTEGHSDSEDEDQRDDTQPKEDLLAWIMAAADLGRPGIGDRVYHQSMVRRYRVCVDVTGRHIEPFFFVCGDVTLVGLTGSFRRHFATAAFVHFKEVKGDPGSIPGRVTPDFRMWESFRTMQLSAGFLGDPPFPPPFHSGAVPYSPQSPSSALKTSLLRATKISPLHFKEDGGLTGCISSLRAAPSSPAANPRKTAPSLLRIYGRLQLVWYTPEETGGSAGRREGVLAAKEVSIMGSRATSSEWSHHRRLVRITTASSAALDFYFGIARYPLLVPPLDLLTFYPTLGDYVAARPRSRSEGALRAALTRTPSASSLLRARPGTTRLDYRDRSMEGVVIRKRKKIRKEGRGKAGAMWTTDLVAIVLMLDWRLAKTCQGSYKSHMTCPASHRLVSSTEIYPDNCMGILLIALHETLDYLDNLKRFKTPSLSSTDMLSGTIIFLADNNGRPYLIRPSDISAIVHAWKIMKVAFSKHQILPATIREITYVALEKWGSLPQE
ncbi:hypothetical protein PR048_025399 [Dryococelus australis]|uniref:HTH psq-type domain-containing protein n=1 Tax=Dryococelus australis TaxID=614101 RepID=A0ABQ9GRB1_9NEOP|nr:hypothetical protein PR048_025399 [Dryococelus australis]